MIEILGYGLQGNLKSYNDFKYAVGQKESSNNYKSQNNIGCLGRYQFCPSTFKRISKMLYGKVISKKDFLNSPSVQDAFFDKLVDLNKASLYKHLSQARQTLGSWVTLSGLIAGAHLGGAGSIAKKNGVLGLIYFGKNAKDKNGTTIKSYIEKFSGYEIPNFTEYSNNTAIRQTQFKTTDPNQFNKNKTVIAKSGTKYETVLGPEKTGSEIDFKKELILPVIVGLISTIAITFATRKR